MNSKCLYMLIIASVWVFFLGSIQSLSKNKLNLSSSFLFSYCLLLWFKFFKEYDFVTWTSTVKFLNLNSNVRLHSHDVKYGTGSGQQVKNIFSLSNSWNLNSIHIHYFIQSVTAVKSADDHNSYWQIKQKPNTSGRPAERGFTLLKRNAFKEYFNS